MTYLELSGSDVTTCSLRFSSRARLTTFPKPEYGKSPIVIDRHFLLSPLELRYALWHVFII